MKYVTLWLLMMLTCCYAVAQDRINACRNDARQLCPQAKGGKAVTDCLLDHQKEISGSCYDTLKQRLDFQACKQDSEQLCNGVQPGEGRIINCLMDHQKELSDACYDTLAKRTKAKGG